MFVFQTAPPPVKEVGTLRVEQFAIDTGVARFDLLLNLVDTEEGINGYLEYNTDLFQTESIARMLGHFTTLIESVMAHPETSLSELPILPPSEQQQLLDWNNTARDHSQTYGHMTGTHQVFEAQVEKTPDATAVVFGTDSLTYRELNARANRLAHYLIERGVGPDVPVGLAVERSVEMVVGVLGILKAGGCYVPLDPEYPSERLKWMLEDVKIRILVTEQKMVDAFPLHDAEVIRLDADRALIDRSSAENPNVPVHEDNLFYCVFTSGSTGRPKGVASPHRCITNLVQWHNSDMCAGARTLQFASLSFDVSCYEIFICIASGGTLFVIPETLRRDTKALAKYLLENRVEKMILPVVVLQQLAEEYLALPELDHNFKEITSAGERMTVTPQVVQLFERLGQCYLRNNYGPSETHVIMAATMEGSPETWRMHPPMGRQITNTAIHILDDRLQKVPVGVAGVIYIGGIPLARGYINRPELTAERFLPDPFSRVPGARMYCTGDLARYLPDGQVEYLARVDHQVKIRGFRVELKEIEVVLASHPAVHELVVIAREDVPGDKRLVAYIVLEDQQHLNVSELRNFLGNKLPDYMVPSAFVFLDEFPLSPNRKIDRRALPAPDHSRPDVETALILPRTPAEEMMANIWGGVLGLEQVGVADNFFELGGHSMLATQVVSRIREQFQVDLQLRALFQHPTVAGLVGEVARLGTQEIVEIPKRVESGPCALSFAQERLWFMDQFEPGSVAYNLTAGLRLTGSLNVAALERAFNEIVRRHESLRTSFASVDGEPVQVISPAHEFRVAIVSLIHLPEAEREPEARLVSLEEFRKPFDLAQAPLLRVTLFKLNEHEHLMLLAIHHIVSDGWSMGVLVREVTELYQAFTNERPSPLPELPIQYADFAVWQRQWLAGERLEAQLSYWRKQLAGAPPVLELPADFPRPAKQSLRGATLNLPLPASLKRELETLGRKHDATLFMVLLAAFQTLLQRYTGQADLVLGTDIANRNRAETEPLIGFFINMLVLRGDLSGNPTFVELLGRARELALGAYAHQDTPLEKLVEELQPQRQASHSPLFQVVFVLQNAPVPALQMEGLILTPVNFENDTVRFDLSLLLGENEAGALNAMWRFRTDLFLPETIVRMHRQYETLLKDIVARPETRLSDLELLSEAERMQRDTKKKELKASSFRKFKEIKPKAIAPAELELVEASYLNGATLPLVFQPRLRTVDLIEWAQRDRERIEGELLKHGAVLFRNFKVEGAGEVSEFARVFAPELMDYREPSTPRSQVKDKIYTSTEFPPDRTILLHNEMSYSEAWPMKVWFCCELAAQQGGETPIADSRQVFARLDPEIRRRFAEKQVLYVRNFGDGFGLSWQTVFGTTSREEVETRCRRAGVEFQWKDEDRLRTRQVRQAVAKHPRTGEEVWFNQAHVHNIFSLESSLRESVLSVADDQEYPLDINTAYGDGTPIEAATLQTINDAYRQATVTFPWQAGDILMVDNMLVAHGRAPFSGPRRIVVAMAEPFSGSNNGHSKS
jgi:amino acid adenylation domain-containing protein